MSKSPAQEVFDAFFIAGIQAVKWTVRLVAFAVKHPVGTLVVVLVWLASIKDPSPAVRQWTEILLTVASLIFVVWMASSVATPRMTHEVGTDGVYRPIVKQPRNRRQAKTPRYAKIEAKAKRQRLTPQERAELKAYSTWTRVGARRERTLRAREQAEDERGAVRTPRTRFDRALTRTLPKAKPKTQRAAERKAAKNRKLNVKADRSFRRAAKKNGDKPFDWATDESEPAPARRVDHLELLRQAHTTGTDYETLFNDLLDNKKDAS